MGSGGGLHIGPPTCYGTPTIFRLYFFAIANNFSMLGGSSARGATSAISSNAFSNPAGDTINSTLAGRGAGFEKV